MIPDWRNAERMVLRVLHLIPCLGHGGAEHQLALNVSHLDRSRFESHVAHLAEPTILGPMIEAAGGLVHSAVIRGRLAPPRRLRGLVDLVRRLDIDLVHASNIEAELYGALLSRFSGVPAVATLTNTSNDERQLIDNPHLNAWKLAAVRNARRLALRSGYKRYVAISEHVKRSAVDRLGLDPDRIRVIYRGIDAEGSILKDTVSCSVREELGIGSSSLVLLTVGRLAPQKGQRYLIEAMPSILQAHGDAVLLVAGVGFLEQTLKKLASSLGVAHAVQFLGRRDDVPRLLAGADIFVFPSVYEGLGVSLIEAAAAGKACVATDVGPLPEVIVDGHDGLLVPPQAPALLAEALIRLGCDPDLRRTLGERAAQKARTRFSIDRAVRELEEVYAELVN